MKRLRKKNRHLKRSNESLNNQNVNTSIVDTNINTPTVVTNVDTNVNTSIVDTNINTSTIDSNVNDSSSSYTQQNESNNNSITVKDSNDTLLISEKEKKVYLPYSKEDVDAYLEHSSNKYSSVEEVVENEFILPINYFTDFTPATRFREAFALYRDREGKTTIESFAFAIKAMKNGRLQPAVVAACKNEKVYNDYITHLQKNDLENFSHFKIEYQVTPAYKK